MSMCMLVYWRILLVSVHSKIHQPRWRVFLVTTTRNSVEDMYIGYLRLIIPCICQINAFFTHAPTHTHTHTHTMCLHLRNYYCNKNRQPPPPPRVEHFCVLSFEWRRRVAKRYTNSFRYNDNNNNIFSRARWVIYTMRRDEMHRHRRSRRRSTTSNDAFFEYFYSFAFISLSVFPQTRGRRIELPV